MIKGLHIDYIRVSTLEQAKEDRAGIEMQKSECAAYRKRKRLPPADLILLDTASGEGIKNRHEMQKLIELVETGRAISIVAYKQDRFSRSAYDCEFLFQLFDKHNVIYGSATEPFVTSEKSNDAIFFRQLNASFAQREQSVRKDRLLGGRYIKVENRGTNFGAEPPFGYRSVERKFVIVEEEAEIIRLIYDLYLKHRSRRRVKAELCARGIRARIKLDDRQIGRILHNPKYTGRMKVKDKVYEQRHPAIIPDNIFWRVKEISDANNQKHVINWSFIAPGYFLRDVAICGHCGHQIVRMETPSTIKGKRLRYYACSLRRKRTRRNPALNCIHATGHKKEQLENRALSEIFKHIDFLMTDDEYLAGHLNIVSKEYIRDLMRKIEGAESAIATRRRAKGRLLDALEHTEDPDIVKRIEQNSRDTKDLEEKLVHLRAELVKEKSKSEDFKAQKAFFRGFRDTWEEANDQEKRDLINALVKSMEVFDNGTFKITYNF